MLVVFVQVGVIEHGAGALDGAQQADAHGLPERVVDRGAGELWQVFLARP